MFIQASKQASKIGGVSLPKSFGGAEPEQMDRMVEPRTPPPTRVSVQPTGDATDNHHDIRPEERWHTTLDQLAREYRDVSAVASEQHDRAGYGARMKHIVFGLPAPVIGIVVAAVAALWISPDAVYFVVPLSSIGSIFAAVHTFFDYGGKAQSHWDYSARYGGVCSKIDATLARDVDFRTPPDAFFAEVRTELGHLNGTAPQLPGKGCCGCSKYESKKPLPAPTRDGAFHYEVRST